MPEAAESLHDLTQWWQVFLFMYLGTSAVYYILADSLQFWQLYISPWIAKHLEVTGMKVKLKVLEVMMGILHSWYGHRKKQELWDQKQHRMVQANV